MQYPICAISKAKYLTRGGWINFKNQSDFEIPFQIHRENGHIMLLVSSSIFISVINKLYFYVFMRYNILIKINSNFFIDRYLF